MSGFDTVAAAIPLAMIALQGCLRGFQMFRDARDLGSDGDIVRSKLLLEEYRLMQWADRVGLSLDGNPNHRLNWPLIQDILQQQSSLLLSAKKLKERYRLDTVEVTTASRLSTGDIGSGSTLAPTKGFARIFAHLKPDFHSDTARVIQASNSPGKQLRWSTLDRKQAFNIIQDIVHFNNGLQDLLELADRDYLELTLSILLREAVSRSIDLSELNAIKSMLMAVHLPDQAAINAAAFMKQIRLILGVDKRDDEIEPSAPPVGMNLQTVRKLRVKRLRRHEIAAPRSGIEVAEYQDRKGEVPEDITVLVEWRVVDSTRSQHERQVIDFQVQGLALLLSGITDQSLHSLPCLGYFHDDLNDCYGLVYQVPQQMEADIPVKIKTWTLRELLSRCVHPSLSTRSRIALNLAEAVLQLHTAGWLHKCIKSSNILFLDEGKDTVDEVILGRPYIVGYDVARKDNSDSLTEPVMETLDDSLYRHPFARSRARLRFRKEFDLYAMGCVFLELSLWKDLVDILSPDGALRQEIAEATRTGKDITLPDTRNLLGTGVLNREISFHVNEGFHEAVKLCFTARPVEQTIDPTSLVVQRSILDSLRPSPMMSNS